jgi:hypothetical protein
MVNQTPVQAFCKKQNVVETATYDSEFMAVHQATEQIMDLRDTLCMMGIPIYEPTWMFGDSQSVITSSTIACSSLNKRHNDLSYRCFQEAISAKILYLIHIDGKLNPSDVLTKFLSWAKFWSSSKHFGFGKGRLSRKSNPTTPITAVISQLATESPFRL